MSLDGPSTETYELRQLAIDAAASFELPEGWDENRAVRHVLAVDAVYSRDIDDALSVTTTPEGHILHASIVDVGTFLDAQRDIRLYAQRKMFTTYHNNRASIPMIPSSISEDKLSIMDGLPRPVITAHIPISKAGAIGRACFTREVAIARRISFDQVDDLIDDGEPTLQSLEVMARRLFATRHGLAVVSLEDVLVEDEDGRVLTVGESYDTGQFIVREAMIALQAAAAAYVKRHHIPVLHRNHTIPLDILPEIVKPHERSLLLGAMAIASYGIQSEGHIGLNQSDYMPFSSPLRRFVDFANHCNLVAYLESREYPFSSKRLAAIAERINRIQQVERRKETRQPRLDNILAKFTRARGMINDGTAGPGELADALVGVLPASEEQRQELRARAAEFIATNIHTARPTFDVILARGSATLQPPTLDESGKGIRLVLEDVRGGRYPYPIENSPLRRSLALAQLAGRLAEVEVIPVIPVHQTREGRILRYPDRFLRGLNAEGRIHFRKWRSTEVREDGQVTMFASVRLNQKYYERSGTGTSELEAVREASRQLIRELDLINNPPVKKKAPAKVLPQGKSRQKNGSRKDDPRNVLFARMSSGGGEPPKYTYSDPEPGKPRHCTVTIVDFDGTPYEEHASGKSKREAQEQAAAVMLAKIPPRPTKKPKSKKVPKEPIGDSPEQTP